MYSWYDDYNTINYFQMFVKLHFFKVWLFAKNF